MMRNAENSASVYTLPLRSSPKKSKNKVPITHQVYCILCRVISLKSILLFSVVFFLQYSSVFAYEINLVALAQIESSNNPKAVSFLGSRYGVGLYQISEVALEDYLGYHKEERITPGQLFDPAVNEKVARWLLFVRIPQVLKYLGRPITLETVLSAYNQGYSPKLATNYIAKYKRALSEVT